MALKSKLTKSNLIKKIIYISFRVIILGLLILSIIGVIIDGENRGQSLFSVVHSTIFLILSFIPSIIEKKFKYEIPDFMQVVYILFCLANNILGEIGNFYATVSWWDDMLHTISGVLIGIVGFSLIDILNKNVEGFKASPLFTAIFVICLAVTVGVVWEIIEYGADYLTGSNMQRFRDSITNEPYVGQEALTDTMSDLVEALLGSMFIAIIGYIDMVKKKNRLSRFSISKVNEKYVINKESNAGEENE